MKRWLVRISVLLVLGAIVNVAVAWALCAYPITPYKQWERFAGNSDLQPFREHGWQPYGVQWEGYHLRASGTQSTGSLYWHCVEVVGYKPHPADVQIESGTTTVLGIGVAMKAGWPTYSLSAITLERQHAPNTTLVTRWQRRGWIIISDTGPSFPSLPIWPGFAINTVFYSGILWLLFAAPFALRKRRRIKRGLCPKCAYDLRGFASQHCPECGKAVTS